MTYTKHNPLHIVPLTIVLCLAGCRQDRELPAEPDLLDVSGRVTVSGKPLERSVVLFLPVNEGSRAKGITDRGGNYTLLDESENPGIEAGEYRVVVKPVRLQTEKKAAKGLPDRSYESFEETPLQITVKDSTDSMDFELKQGPAAERG